MMMAPCALLPGERAMEYIKEEGRGDGTVREGCVLLIGDRKCGKTTMLMWCAMRSVRRERERIMERRRRRRAEERGEGEEVLMMEKKMKGSGSRHGEKTSNSMGNSAYEDIDVPMVVPDSAPNSPDHHGDHGDDDNHAERERDEDDNVIPPAPEETTAQEPVRGVLFLCQHHRIEAEPPWLPSDPKTFADDLEHVKMKYVSSYDDVKMVRAAAHTRARGTPAVTTYPSTHTNALCPWNANCTLVVSAVACVLKMKCVVAVCTCTFVLVCVQVMSAMHCRDDADLPKLIVIDELRAICGSASSSGFGGNRGVPHARMGNGAYIPNETRRDVETKIAKALAQTKDAVEYIRCVHMNRRSVHLSLARVYLDMLLRTSTCARTND